MNMQDKSGVFELWAEGLTRACVVIAKGETGEPQRVGIEIYTVTGNGALLAAMHVYNSLVEVYKKSTRSNF